MEISKLAKLYAKYPELYEQHSKKYGQQTAPYSLISTEPLIFYLASSLGQWGHASLQPIFDYLQDQTVYFLQKWCWNTEDTDEVEKIKKIEVQHTNQYPQHKFTHLCNTRKQAEIFLEYKLNAIFCNQNCLIDEKIFKPILSIPKSFDAVYDAKFTTFKRHYLAQKIDNIAFVYYYSPMDDAGCYQEVRSLFPHAHYFNDAFTQKGLNFILSSPIVNECLNACRVGLCLSSIEGAMYASIQYLLSGLPVVSTKSKGGRDVFFDEEYTLIVEDDPEAVKEGVDELIKRNISSDYIRSKVLEKVKHHRLTLIALIQSIYDQEGIQKNFSAEWDQIFFNKLYKLQSPEIAIKQLKDITNGNF